MSIVEIEDKLLVENQNIGVSVYDYDFELFFECKHPYMLNSKYCRGQLIPDTLLSVFS